MNTALEHYYGTATAAFNSAVAQSQSSFIILYRLLNSQQQYKWDYKLTTTLRKQGWTALYNVNYLGNN